LTRHEVVLDAPGGADTPLPGVGAVLETVGPLGHDASAHERWRVLVCKMSAALGWPAALPVVRVCANTTILALHAPSDQLMLATDINEWAWELAVRAGNLNGLYAEYKALHSGIATFPAALAHFRTRSATECNPALMALLHQAQLRRIPALLDDALLSLGTGSSSHTWTLGELPAPEMVPWDKLGCVPTLLVTGSNGKTTSVRLLAAIAQRAGRHVAYCSTEGVYVDGLEIATGDYAGPAGARTALRQENIDFAVLEMARGGILRRGLALDMAQTALITNVSPEHFGEYGVDNINELADTKLVLAQALGCTGTLVLNADDPILLARAAEMVCKVALFALNYAHPALQALRAMGGWCCGGQDGQLMLFYQNQSYDLGAIAAMPLTVQGSARYNIANCAGAAMSAAATGMPPAEIAQVLAQFGQSRFDNPGRLERWNLPDLTVLLDYAHNPEGLSGLLMVAKELNANGRIGLLLGQAGNRNDDAICELAATAAQFQPDRIVLKDIPSYMRGRMVGEVPALLHTQLLNSGMDAQHIEMILPEVEAACALLRWAKPGDVLVLPVHDKQSKRQMQEILDTLQGKRWYTGQLLPLPPPL
jgi:cyanophycin synthetase